MESCFVIMPIGDQKYGDFTIAADELKKKYDNLIKEAILSARPDLEIYRADDISLSGTITTDIFTRIMHSKYVVADVTYPNANVFYELGLRHACKPGTIIIRSKDGPKVPFDISHLRHIEYEDTSTGLKELSEKISRYFDNFDSDPNRPDNHMLELAKLTKYKFQDYSDKEEVAPETKLFMNVLKNPELLGMISRQQSGEKIESSELLAIIAKNHDIAEPMISSLVKSGQLSLQEKSTTTTKSTNRRTIAPPPKKKH